MIRQSPPSSSRVRTSVIRTGNPPGSPVSMTTRTAAHATEPLRCASTDSITAANGVGIFELACTSVPFVGARPDCKGALGRGQTSGYPVSVTELLRREPSPDDLLDF